MQGSAHFEGGRGLIESVISLGTGGVGTGTFPIGRVPKRCRIVRIRINGTAVVVGTSLTAMVRVWNTAATVTSDLLAAAADIKFTTATAARLGLVPALHADQARRDAVDGQIVDCVITATAITAGPGEVLVEVEFAPR